MHRLPNREVARQPGLLPQVPVTPDGITVVELVRRGRTPYTRVLRQWPAEDTRAVDEALTATGLTVLAQEQVTPGTSRTPRS